MPRGSIWEGDSQSRGEAEDAYYQLNWGKVDRAG